MSEEKQKKSKSAKETLRVLKYALFAASAGIIEAVTFALMNETLKWAYWPSYLIALVLSVIWNFTFNRKYTYRAANNVPLAMMKTVLFYVVFTPVTMIGGNYFDKIGVNHYLILIVTMALNFVTEYLYQRFYTFKDGLDTNKQAEKADEVNESNEENVAKNDEVKKATSKSMVRVTIWSVVLLVVFIVLGVIFPSLYQLPHKLSVPETVAVTAPSGAQEQKATFDNKTKTLTIVTAKDGTFLNISNYVDVPTINENPMLLDRSLENDPFTAFAFSESIGYNRIKKVVVVGGPSAGTYTFETKGGKVQKATCTNGSKKTTATYKYNKATFVSMTSGKTTVTADDLKQDGSVKFTEDKNGNIGSMTKDGKTYKFVYNKKGTDDYKFESVQGPKLTENFTYSKHVI